MKKNKSTSKSAAKPTKPIKSAKTVAKVNKPNTTVKKPALAAIKPKTVALKPIKLAKKAQVSEVKEVVKTAKIEKTSKITPAAKMSIKSAPVEKVAIKVIKQLGHARVIEPLSWDAEKPKLNLTLTNKISRKDLKDKEDAEVKSYTIKARYTVGDRVMHADFGKGLVRDLIGDFKIRVAFRDFEKVLVHGINS